MAGLFFLAQDADKKAAAIPQGTVASRCALRVFLTPG
jgi:hypothetical protein